MNNNKGADVRIMRKEIIVKGLMIILITSYISLIAGCMRLNFKSDDITIEKEYVINVDSKKVHSTECGSGKRISKQNKKIVKDSILQICSNGYKICKNCNAGLRTKHSALLYELPTTQEYIRALNEMGDWYTKHIPTYCKKIQVEKLGNYKGKEKYILQYSVINMRKGLFGSKELFNVISSSEQGKEITTYNKDITDITCAGESAITNYKDNFKNIDFEKNLAYYHCQYLENCEDYSKAGDDCVRYVFSALNHMDNNFISDLVCIAETDWRKIRAARLCTDSKKIAKAMIIKGFKIYDSIKQDIDYNNDGKIDYSTNIIDKDFKLKEGDLIVRENHIHVFMDNKMLNAKNFGWGKVNREYPKNYSFYVNKIEENYYITCDNDKDANGNFNLYNRVYRYVGGDDEN